MAPADVRSHFIVKYYILNFIGGNVPRGGIGGKLSRVYNGVAGCNSQVAGCSGQDDIAADTGKSHPMQWQDWR